MAAGGALSWTRPSGRVQGTVALLSGQRRLGQRCRIRTRSLSPSLPPAFLSYASAARADTDQAPFLRGNPLHQVLGDIRRVTPALACWPTLRHRACVRTATDRAVSEIEVARLQVHLEAEYLRRARCGFETCAQEQRRAPAPPAEPRCPGHLSTASSSRRTWPATGWRTRPFTSRTGPGTGWLQPYASPSMASSTVNKRVVLVASRCPGAVTAMTAALAAVSSDASRIAPAEG